MADRFPKQLVGVADGTQVPSRKADGREVRAKERSSILSKVAGEAYASGDRIYLGKKPPSEKVVDIQVNTGTSLGTTTLSVGDGTTADKYVAAKTVTATDSWTSIGPKAATLDDPVPGDETLWLTLGVGGIAGGTDVSFRLITSGL